MEIIGISRAPLPPSCLLHRQLLLSIGVVSYFPPFSVWISRAATREISGLVSTKSPSTFVDDETSTFVRLYPREIMGNPGFPRKLAHPFLSLSLDSLPILFTLASCSFIPQFSLLFFLCSIFSPSLDVNCWE